MPLFVTRTASRKPEYRGGVTVELPYLDEGHYAWLKSVRSRSRFTLPSLKSKGAEVYNQLLAALQEKDEKRYKALEHELEKYCIRSYDELSESEKWELMAAQMPGDWGPVGNNKAKLKNIITKRVSGRVLEAMCGFTSYVGESEKIKEVVALDFCIDSLERYDYPERKRILYDLEEVVRGGKMEFFPDGYFQSVCISFGVCYLSNEVPVYREFHRILSAGGRLLVVGNNVQGYEDLVKRWFRPSVCRKEMESAGFSASVNRLRSLKVRTELGNYYLVEGKKVEG